MINLASTTIDLADPRTQRALVIAADAGQWARVTDRRSGAIYFGIPSSRRADLHYLCDRSHCSCPDQKYRPWDVCKHRRAVAIYEVLGA